MFTSNIEGPSRLAGIQRAHLASDRRFRQLQNYETITIGTQFNCLVDVLTVDNPLVDILQITFHLSEIQIEIIKASNTQSRSGIYYYLKDFSFTIYLYRTEHLYCILGYEVCHLTASSVSSILCSLHVGTLVANRTTALIQPSPKNCTAFAISIILVTTLTIVSKCYASTNAAHNIVKLHRYSKSSSSPIVTADLVIRINSSKLVLSVKSVKSDTSVIVKNSKQLLHNRNFTILPKTDRFRTKREYLANFDNILRYYHDREELKHNRKVKNRSENIRKELANYAKHPNTVAGSEGNFSETNFSESVSNTSVDELHVKNALDFEDDTEDVSYKSSVKKDFQFESSTQRSMPPAHVSENSLNDSSVLVLVVSVVVLTVTLGLVTCALSHYKGGTAANSHDAAQRPTTAPMLSVVSAGAAAGVGGMDRLRSRGTARELATTRDRQVRVHAVHTDLALNLPPSISLPDGEDPPFNSRLQIRDAEQEAEIYQKCIKPPPNRTVLESESPPPYRSSSAGLLGSTSGSSSSSTDWSGGSAPLVVRCHSMSSTSKRQDTASGGQKTDFIQRTVKRFTGKKNQPLTATNVPVVIVPTKPRRISEQQPQTQLQQQQQSQQQQQQQNSTTGRPKPNV